MQTYHHIADLAGIDAPLALAMGVFDGVHLGHRAVIDSAIADARKTGGQAMVVTFEPHPIRVLRPESAPRLLASLQHKEILLERLGLDGLVVVPFDRIFAELPPGQFVGRLVESCRNLSSISVGADWRFGAGRAGNAELLTQLGSEHGYQTFAIDAVSHGSDPISSTRIRAAIDCGDLDEAKALLGRDYTVLGTVVAGKQLGRTIGVPTANLRVQSEQLPPDGVYAVRCLHGERIIDGVANLGVRPTIQNDAHTRQLEVHLLDFDEEIYGDTLEVTFVQFLRGEKKFDGINALKAQIAEDIEAARGAIN